MVLTSSVKKTVFTFNSSATRSTKGATRSADFPATVMPFILRGIALYGINCVFIDNPTRVRAWDLLARHVTADRLDRMAQVFGLSEVIERSVDLLEGRLRGRRVVDVTR